METGRRVFYSLAADEKLAANRNSKLRSLLVQHLEQRGLIFEAELDTSLFDCIR